MQAPSQVGYLELLRRRPAFRNLWLAEVASLAGDWFTLIALYDLLLEHTGRGELVGLMLAVRFLPIALFGPVAGVVADRFPRRTVLVAADVLRAVTVLGFLAVRDASQVWLVYGLVALQMTLTAFFEPAEQAAIGTSVEPDEVVAANTLAGATWSAMLSVGAVTGGLLVSWVGRDAGFVVDAASYLVSAVLIFRARLVHVPPPPATQGALGQGLTDLREGLRLAATDARVRRALSVKSGWALAGGGAILLYAVLGEREFSTAGHGTAAIGVILSMRGVGALLGPLVARRLGGDDPVFLSRAITASFVVTGVFYALFALAPSLWPAALLLAVAHTGVSTQWVFSNSLINLTVAPELRGRVFAVDATLYMALMAFSSWATGAALDRLGLAPRTAMLGLAALLLVPLVLWTWLGRAPAPAPARPA